MLVNPRELAYQGARLQAELSLRQVEKLHDLVLGEGADTVSVSLEFTLDDCARPRMRCRILGLVHLECQRCLAPIAMDLDRIWCAVLVDSEEQAQKIPPREDVLVVQQTEVNIVQLIEDDLLLSLPMAPKHIGCTQPARAEVAASVSPFSILARLQSGE